MKYFTSESVSAGHPDKIADQISDAILDAALKAGDQTTRVACETLVTTNTVILAGEVKNFNVSDEEVETIVRNKVKEIGYEQEGFHWKTVKVTNLMHRQSPDIALGTDDFGAGDQGMMFGYATNTTSTYLAPSHHFSNRIQEILRSIRESYDFGPDAKSQVTVEFHDGFRDKFRIDTIVISQQHHGSMSVDFLQDILMNEILRDPEIKAAVDDQTIYHINPTGMFVIGGPDGDAGLTGRKIIVDTYGGAAPHGGGAFSGKDPTKVDRSAAYMARWLAKNIVATGWSEECTIQISYAIGIEEATSLSVSTIENDGRDHEIEKYIAKVIDLRPKAIIDRFGLFDFHEYSKNSVLGHFGDKDVPWEKLNMF